MLDKGSLEQATKSTARARRGSSETVAVGGDGSAGQSNHARQKAGSRKFGRAIPATLAAVTDRRYRRAAFQ